MSVLFRIGQNGHIVVVDGGPTPPVSVEGLIYLGW